MHLEPQKDYVRKLIKLIIIINFSCLFALEVNGQDFSERIMYHINNDKTEFIEGADTFADFKVDINSIIKKHNKLKIKGKIVNDLGIPLSFFKFYIVELTDLGSYKVINKIGESDIQGRFNIVTKLDSMQYVFVTCDGFLVRSIIPKLRTKRKIIIEN